jgi:hypothetical protein
MRVKYEDRLRKLVGRPVRFFFAGGTQVTGHLAECRPGEGVVELALLRDAEVLSMDGAVLLRSSELPVPAGRLERYEDLH